VSGAAAAAAAAVDVNVATPESLSRACARKGRTALRKYLTNARLPDKSKMADRQISPLCRSHRKINAQKRPLAARSNRPIGIRLPRLQLQLQDNINVSEYLCISQLAASRFARQAAPTCRSHWSCVRYAYTYTFLLLEPWLQWPTSEWWNISTITSICEAIKIAD